MKKEGLNYLGFPEGIGKNYSEQNILAFINHYEPKNELGFPIGTGKFYDLADLESFIDSNNNQEQPFPTEIPFKVTMGNIKAPRLVAPFGETAKDLRYIFDLSQRAVSAQLGIDVTTLSRIEAGNRLPPRKPEFYQKFQAIFNLTPAQYERMFGYELKKNDEPNLPDSINVVFAAGRAILFRIEVPETDFTQEEGDFLTNLIGQRIKSSTLDYLRRQHRSQKLIDEFYDQKDKT